jgi:hypothetical protein
MGLILELLSGNSQTIYFSFSYYDDDSGNRLGYYKFKSWEIDQLTTSTRYQELSSEIVNGPGSINEVPVREGDAVLMTVSAGPVTWSSKTYTMRLILRGVVQWDWQVTFEVWMLPFRLDGTWTQQQ